MRRIHVWVSLALLVVVLVAACGGSEELALVGTEWELVELDGQPPLDSTQITLRFEADALSGRAGCNQYGGDYTLGSGGALDTGDMYKTEMWCAMPDGVMDQENAYLERLGSVSQAELDGERLILRAGAQETLVFEPLAGE
jgi:heat shock protein HslJ